ncbi:hypothetical protein Bca101_051135 [Brassica carinata]
MVSQSFLSSKIKTTEDDFNEKKQNSQAQAIRQPKLHFATRCTLAIEETKPKRGNQSLHYWASNGKSSSSRTEKADHADQAGQLQIKQDKSSGVWYDPRQQRSWDTIKKTENNLPDHPRGIPDTGMIILYTSLQATKQTSWTQPEKLRDNLRRIREPYPINLCDSDFKTRWRTTRSDESGKRSVHALREKAGPSGSLNHEEQEQKESNRRNEFLLP